MTRPDEGDPLLSSVSEASLPSFTESMHLVTAAQGGDEEALDALLRRYEGRLRRIVRIKISARLRRVVESVDIVQDTLRSAAARIRDLELRSTASILQWLSRIAENQMIDVHRHFYSQKRDKTREVVLGEGNARDDESPGFQVSSDSLGPDEKAAARELERLVDAAVAELPDDYREVILLRTYYGGSWDEVTRQMGRPNAEATRQLHRRARLKLARLLEGRI